METPINVALITSVTSAVIAVWGLLTARVAKARSLEAEEMAKRSEQVRIKGLEAGATVIKSLTDFMIGIETVIQLIKIRGGLFEEDVGELSKVSLASANMRRCILEHAIFLTGEIVSEVEVMVSNNNLNPENLPSRLEGAKRLHSSLVLLIQKVYLSEMTVRPQDLVLQIATRSK